MRGSTDATKAWMGFPGQRSRVEFIVSCRIRVLWLLGAKVSSLRALDCHGYLLTNLSSCAAPRPAQACNSHSPPTPSLGPPRIRNPSWQHPSGRRLERASWAPTIGATGKNELRSLQPGIGVGPVIGGRRRRIMQDHAGSCRNSRDGQPRRPKDAGGEAWRLCNGEVVLAE